MSNREHMMGHLPAAGDLYRGDLPEWLTPTFPFGVPKRILREAEDFAKRWTTQAPMKPLLDPLKQLCLMESDVPGVLINAGPEAIFESLERIERKLGQNAADRAYHAIFKRALDDNDTATIAAMVKGRERAMQARNAEQTKAIDPHRAIGQTAAEVIHAEQRRRAKDEHFHRSVYETLNLQTGLTQGVDDDLRNDLERAWRAREGIPFQPAPALQFTNGQMGTKF